MNLQFVSWITGWSVRRPLALLLAAMVTMIGFPATAGQPAAGDRTVPHSFRIVNGNGLFQVDLSDMFDNLQEVMAGNGRSSITIRKAVFTGQESDAGTEHPFAFGDTPSLDDIDVFAMEEGEGSSTAGLNAGQVAYWRDIITVTVGGSADGFAITYLVGDDTFSMTVPREAMGNAAEPEELPPFIVTVNGVVQEMDAVLISSIALELSREGLLPVIERPQDLVDLVTAFQDQAMFANAYAGFHMIIASIMEVLHQAYPHSTCAWTCLGCAAALITYGATILTLIAICGATLGLGCLAAVLGHEAAVLILAAGCGQCAVCIGTPDPEEPEPEDPCPCEGEPDCECDEDEKDEKD